LLLTLTLGACATVTVTPYQPTLTTVRALSDPSLASVAVGEFTAAPDLAASANRVMSVRGSTIKAPAGGFTAVLRDGVQAGLAAGGRFDPASPVRINGVLVKNHLSEDMANGVAELVVHVVVRQGEQVLLDKDVAATLDWKSAFLGASAIPAAMRQYEALYTSWIDKLFSDPQFQQALRTGRVH